MKKLLILSALLIFACTIDDGNDDDSNPQYVEGYPLGEEVLRIEVDQGNFMVCQTPYINNSQSFNCSGNNRGFGISRVVSYEKVIVDEDFYRNGYRIQRKNADGFFVLYEYEITKNCVNGTTFNELFIEDNLAYWVNCSECGGIGVFSNFDYSQLNTVPVYCQGNSYYSTVDGVAPLGPLTIL
tara:strand:+ start:308 stop:856 length:549 start_codon:yes stop_codon:yes gene_type:complete